MNRGPWKVATSIQDKLNLNVSWRSTHSAFSPLNRGEGTQKPADWQLSLGYVRFPPIVRPVSFVSVSYSWLLRQAFSHAVALLSHLCPEPNRNTRNLPVTQPSRAANSCRTSPRTVDHISTQSNCQRHQYIRLVSMNLTGVTACD